jgi:hypothetical protein
MTPTHGKNSTSGRIPWILMGLLAAVLLGLWRSSRPLDSVSKSEVSHPMPPAAPRHATNPIQDSQLGQNDIIQVRVRALLGAGSKESKAPLLADLKSQLLALPKAQASSTIQALLNTGADTPTGEAFRVGPEGLLASAPSLRTQLLDLLGQVDPSAAAEYAKRILSEQGSPDEWAVSLRNYANGSQGAEARDYLRSKVSELLHQDQWRQDPSVGYLEAFDVAVYAGGATIVSDLATILKDKENPATAHAAFLALDRLTLKDPASTLEDLLNTPALAEGREATRANYFARANVADPAQRNLLERYLLTPGRTAAELQSFAGVFPNANFMISQNLLTKNPSITGAELARSDRVALETVQAWLQDPRFESLRGYLEKSKARLTQFVPGPPR